MSATQAQLKNHFLNLGNQGALYVWGANGQIITKELMNMLYKTFGSNTYNRAYYDNKLKAGKGKPGADCSGAICPVSKYDTTAAGYYNRCKQKGTISTLPKNQICLVFKTNSKGVINHVGCYTGDGYVSEMASSQTNYQRKALAGNGWDLWGMPDFISNPETVQGAVATSGTTYNKIEGLIDTVAEVQIWLNQTFNAGLVVDNCYGPKTKAALVKALQITLNDLYNAGLEEDGIFGPKTKAACKVVDFGDKGMLVKILQALLICHGYYSAYLDGDFGSKTANAVYSCQGRVNIAQDKQAGPITFEKLCA
mgnify:CR=1 FL=1